jgi:hypothetical protein
MVAALPMALSHKKGSSECPPAASRRRGLAGTHVHFRNWPTPWRAAWMFMLAILGTYYFGQWLGYSILEQHGPDYDVYLKRETLNGVRVVMAMSHHTILYSNKTIYIVPTDEVVRIVIPQK